MPAIRRKSRKARARAKEERDLRLKEVARLRLVQCWTFAEIAQVLNVTERTVERDYQIIKKRLRASAEKDLGQETRDIAERLKLSHEEKIKRLWNEYIRLEQSALPTDSPEKKAARIEETRPARVRLLSQILQIEDSQVEQLRKLGLVKGEMDIDSGEGSVLLEIKARRAKVEQLRDDAGAAPSASSKETK